MIKLWRKIKRIWGVVAEVDELSGFAHLDAIRINKLFQTVLDMQKAIDALKEKDKLNE